MRKNYRSCPRTRRFSRHAAGDGGREADIFPFGGGGISGLKNIFSGSFCLRYKITNVRYKKTGNFLFFSGTIKFPIFKIRIKKVWNGRNFFPVNASRRASDMFYGRSVRCSGDSTGVEATRQPIGTLLLPQLNFLETRKSAHGRTSITTGMESHASLTFRSVC